MSKKRGRNSGIHIHLTNRWLYTIIAIGILAAVGVGVYAATYSSSGAGHPYTEISTCPANQILKMNSAGNAWTCAGDSVSTCPANQILKMNAGGTAWTCGTDNSGTTYSILGCSSIVGASDSVINFPATSAALREFRVHGSGTATFSWEVKNDPNSDYMHVDLYKNDVLVGLQYKYCYGTGNCAEAGHTIRMISQNVWYADSETLSVSDGDRITLYGKAIFGGGGVAQLRNFRVGYCLSATPAEIVF